jgi:hypothetical protein
MTRLERVLSSDLNQCWFRQACSHFGLLAAILLALSGPSLAQDQATMVGTATDPSGAAVPGVKVTVVNSDKGFTRQTVTNSAGDYTVAQVPIGQYSVVAEARGFRRLVVTGITLNVGQQQRVNLALAVGQVSQEITVSGNAIKVETENARVSDVITGSQVADLNLNGRNYQALAVLVPGAAPTNSFNTTVVGHNAQATISFNGGRREHNNWEIDGGNDNDESGGGASPQVIPNLDSIAEFRITTSNYGADVGKRSGATIEVVTKSGTKQFHGTAYEFVRNDHFDANDFFINRQPWSSLGPSDCAGNGAGPCNAPKTPLKQNNYGFSLGGPVYIPGVYNTTKSKTFFFYSENWVKYRNGTVLGTGTADVPSLLMRQGDFSQCDPASSNYNVVVASGCVLPTNPATGQHYPGDVVPIDPNAQTLLNSFVPLPNSGPIGWVAAHSVPTDYRQDSIRVDQNINDKTALFFRFTNDAWQQTVVPSEYSSANFDSVESIFSVPAKSVVLHLTRTLRPDLMNEFIVAWGNDPHHITALPGPGSPSHSITKPSDWTASQFFAANKSQPFLPGVSVSGGLPFSFNEDVLYGVFFNRVPTWTVKDNLAYTHGTHSLRTGVFIMRTAINSMNGIVAPQGEYSFTGGGPITTGNGLADMYTGRIQAYTEGTFVVNGKPVGTWGYARARHQSYEPYVQDDWKVNRRLTLNLGVRYYYYTAEHDVQVPTTDSDFYPNLYDPAKQAQLDINGNIVPGTGYNYTEYGNGLVMCGSSGVPKGCRQIGRNTLSPRFGFAFDPTGSGKTAIRGGYGLFYDIGAGEDSQEDGQGNPPSYFNPNGYNIVGYGNLIPGPVAPVGIGAWVQNGPNTSVQQFNLTVQHEFRGNNFLSVAYVGSLGNHLSRGPNINQVPDGSGTMNVPALAGTPGCSPSGSCDVQSILIHQLQPTIFFTPYRGYTSITWNELAASSRYNSLQANFRRTVGRGLTLQVAYTYAKAIDNASTPGANLGVDFTNENRWYSQSDFNRTHTLVANYIYNLPLFQSTSSQLLRSALGGWQFSGISSFYSGTPVTFGCSENGYSSGVGLSMQCNTLGPLRIHKGTTQDPTFGPVATWYDPSTVGMPALSQFSANGEPGMFGYMGRNVLTGPGRNNWDLALLKNFSLPWAGGERSNLQFRLETFNTFNHTQWQSIRTGCSGDTPFGAPCSGPNNYNRGEVTSAWSPRIVQLGLKFVF